MANRRTPEIIVASRIPVDWGVVTVAQLLRPDEKLAKAVRVPYPSLTLKSGIWVPDKHGEISRTEKERWHSIDWKDVITGGCNKANRRHLLVNGITAVVIPFRYDPGEYESLLLGRGLLNRR